MRGPGEQHTEQHRDQRIGGDAAHQNTQARNVLVGRDDLEQLRERNQHETEPDGDPADVAHPSSTGPEHRDARQQQQRRKPRDLEREGLHDEGGADIRPEHDRKRGNERDEATGGERGDHQPGRGAALEDGGHAEPRRRLDAAAERQGEEPSQVGAEGALHPALHHMDAPQQQRDRAGEIEEAQRCVHRALFVRGSG